MDSDVKVAPFTTDEWAGVKEEFPPFGDYGRAAATIDALFAALDTQQKHNLVLETVLANIMMHEGPIAISAQNMNGAATADWKIQITTDGNGGVRLQLMLPERKIVIARG